MGENVIFDNPIVLVGFILSLLLCGFGLIKKTRFGGILSVLLFLATATYALLKGAELYEVGTVSAAFFAINLLPLWKKGGK